METKWRHVSITDPPSDRGYFIFKGDTFADSVGIVTKEEDAKLIAAAPEMFNLIKDAIEALEWYMENTKPDNGDWNSFHDLGMNVRMIGEELIKKATE